MLINILLLLQFGGCFLNIFKKGKKLIKNLKNNCLAGTKDIEKCIVSGLGLHNRMPNSMLMGGMGGMGGPCGMPNLTSGCLGPSQGMYGGMGGMGNFNCNNLGGMMGGMNPYGGMMGGMNSYGGMGRMGNYQMKEMVRKCLNKKDYRKKMNNGKISPMGGMINSYGGMMGGMNSNCGNMGGMMNSRCGNMGGMMNSLGGMGGMNSNCGNMGGMMGGMNSRCGNMGGMMGGMNSRCGNMGGMGSNYYNDCDGMGPIKYVNILCRCKRDQRKISNCKCDGSE